MAFDKFNKFEEWVINILFANSWGREVTKRGTKPDSQEWRSSLPNVSEAPPMPPVRPPKSEHMISIDMGTKENRRLYERYETLIELPSRDYIAYGREEADHIKIGFADQLIDMLRSGSTSLRMSRD